MIFIIQIFVSLGKYTVGHDYLWKLFQNSIVLKYIKNIFRLDFDILVLDQPDSTTTIGACTGKDTLLVDLSNGSDPPTLCGTISGHHSKGQIMYKSILR